MEKSIRESRGLLRELEPWLQERCAWRSSHMAWVTERELELTVKMHFRRSVKAGALDGVPADELMQAADGLLRFCLRKTVFESLWMRLSGWLNHRCGVTAARLGDVDPEVLHQAVMERAIKRIHGRKDQVPWFDQAPTKSILAQTKVLFNTRLLNEQSAIIRKRKKKRKLEELERASREPPAPPRPEPRKPDPGELIALRPDLVKEVSTPQKRLCMLSRYRPEIVRLAQIEAAKNTKQGPSNMIVRAAHEALGLLFDNIPFYRTTKRVRPWTRRLAVIYYAEGPVVLPDYCEYENTASNIEHYARAVLREFIELLAAEQEATP